MRVMTSCANTHASIVSIPEQQAVLLAASILFLLNQQKCQYECSLCFAVLLQFVALPLQSLAEAQLFEAVAVRRSAAFVAPVEQESKDCSRTTSEQSQNSVTHSTPVLAVNLG